MKDLLEMIQHIGIQEALALTVKEDIDSTIANMLYMFSQMTEDQILVYGLDQHIISIEDIDEVRNSK